MTGAAMAAGMPRTAAPAASRNAYLDAAKGIGILLVVVFHTYRDLLEAHQTFPDPLLPYLDYLAYCFHMPLFFIIAGQFVDRSLRKGVQPFLRDKVVHIYYPYLLWSTITIVLATVLSSYVNSPHGLQKLIRMPIDPPLHFWFLLTLFVFYLLYAFMRNMRVLVPAAIAGAFLYDVPAMPHVILNYLHFFIFFVGGVLIAQRGWLRTNAGWWLGLGLLLVWTGAGYRYGIDTMSVLMVPAGFAGYVVTIAAGRALQAGFAGRLLNFIGERSLSIYLIHVLFTAAARTVLHKIMHGGSPYVVLLLCSFAGVAGPLLVYQIAERLRLLTLAGLGRDAPRPVRF